MGLGKGEGQVSHSTGTEHQPRLGPVAIRAPDVDHAQRRQLGQYLVDQLRRRVVGVDEEGYAGLGNGSVRDSVHANEKVLRDCALPHRT